MTGGLKSFEAREVTRTRPRKVKPGQQTVFDRLQRDAERYHSPTAMTPRAGSPAAEDASYTGLAWRKPDLVKPITGVIGWRDEWEPFDTKVVRTKTRAAST